MKIPHTLAAALAVCALLTACSSHAASSPGSASSTSPGPGEGEVTPSATAAITPSTTATADLDDWPTEPATADKLPTGIHSAAFAHGYTGAAFLDRLTKRWNITMSARKKNDFKANDAWPAVWISSGSTHPTPDTKVSIAVVWSLGGDLESLTCTADRKAADHPEFLRQCAELDHPGAHPQAAANWLQRTTPAVDKAFAQANKPVGSALHRSGRAATYLQEYGTGEDTATYALRVFGTAS
ncbi:hypothetical protein [Streptomyces sp. NPDC057280]|uniref:hypothetical protein n=1 Tax=Streptomyces sp. NPDC057280 TaxID=3346081 RepID=UPI00362D1577